MPLNIDFNIDNEMYKRFVKYVVHLTSIFLLIKFIPTCEMTSDEVLQIVLVSTSVYAILDMYMPSVKIENGNKK
jgi:hypothetical protein